jgi:hypothetical protein
MRYVILVLINIPLILLAVVNTLTQYKMKKISKARFRHQAILWFVILVVLTCSFPVYNQINDRPVLDSSGLSSFDIIQTTAIIYMIYAINDHRRKIEYNEKVIRELHQEISIKLAEK